MTILNNDAIPLHPSLTCCSSLAASALVYNQQTDRVFPGELN